MSIPNNLLKWLQQHPQVREDEEKFQGPCPVHAGADNPTAFVVWKNSGVWRCYSRLCHSEGDRAHHLCKHLDLDSGDPAAYNDVDSFGNKNYQAQRIQKTICTREEVVERLCEIPSQYAISRGFSPYILKKYCIGTSYKKGPMAYRCVCPIFSDDYKYVIGFSGRTVQDRQPKWFHYGLKTGHNLYNVWFAKTAIRNKKSVILVEGIFDVLRLEEAGIKNSVCTFGLSLGSVQEKLLQKLGVETIIFGHDNDEAAKAAIAAISKKYELYYNFETLEPPKKDWGECTPQEIKDHIIVRNKKLLA